MQIQTQPPSALEILQGYRLPLSFAEAHDYLVTLLRRIELLALYRLYFPEQYARSKKRTFPTVAEAYSPLEAEFLELVDVHLFPIHLDFMIYASGPDERSAVIPARSLGQDWWNVEYDDLSAGWQFMLYLIGQASAEDLTLQQPQLVPERDSPLVGVDWSRVQWDEYEARWNEVAKQLHPSLAHFPRLIEVVYHDTGNAFLDTHDEAPLEDFFWKKEDMDILIDHYRQAETIIGQIESLMEWLGEAPEHLQTVLKLLEEDKARWTTANQD
jgi:hypothetical protein